MFLDDIGRVVTMTCEVDYPGTEASYKVTEGVIDNFLLIDKKIIIKILYEGSLHIIGDYYTTMQSSVLSKEVLYSVMFNDLMDKMHKKMIGVVGCKPTISLNKNLLLCT